MRTSYFSPPSWICILGLLNPFRMQPLVARAMNYFRGTLPHLYEIRFLIAGMGIVYYGIYKIQKAGEKKAISDEAHH